MKRNTEATWPVVPSRFAQAHSYICEKPQSVNPAKIQPTPSISTGSLVKGAEILIKQIISSWIFSS